MRVAVFWTLLFLLLPLVVFQPYKGVILYLCFNILRPDMLHVTPKAPLLLIVASMVGTVINAHKLQFKRLMNRELLLMIWLCASLYVSIAFSKYTIIEAPQFAKEMVKLTVVIGLMILLIDTKKKILLLENLMLGFMVFLGAWGIEQSFLGNVRLEGLGGKAIPDSNGVGALFVMFFPLALGKVINAQNNKDKCIGVFASFTICSLIILTKSRGAFLGLFMCLGFEFIKSKKKIFYITVMMVMLIAVSPFISQEYIKRIKSITGNEETGELGSSAGSRLIFWQVGMMIFVDNPLFGCGFFAYPVDKLQYEYRFNHLEDKFREECFRRYNPYVSHSSWVQILSEVGMFGSIPYFGLIILCFIDNRKYIKKSQEDNKELRNLLDSINKGILGFCVCITFINSLLIIFLPVQIVACSIIRNLASAEANTKTG